MLAIVVFLAALALLGRHLDFSGYAHPDERNKVNQILRGEYNFHHPLLMIRSTRIAADVLGKSSDFEAVKRIGRAGSVLFSAAALALLVFVAARVFGPWAGAGAGVFLLANPHVFELAHYLKEDPGLLFGVSLSLFAMLVYSRHPCVPAALALGVAAAVAVSAKYAGGIVLPFCLFIVLASSARRSRDVLLLLAGFAVACLVINLPAFLALGSVSNKLGRELTLLSGGAKGISRSVPHGVYSAVYWSSATPVLIALLVAYGWTIYQRRFRLPAIEWVMILLPLGYVLILSFLPKTHHRYFLPCAALFACLSAAGLEPIRRLRYGRTAAVALIVLSTAWQAPRLLSLESGFARDHRQELVTLMRGTLPQGSVIFIDECLEPPEYEGLAVIREKFPTIGSLEALRARGVTHVVVTEKKYGAYFAKRSKPVPGKEEEFAQARALYDDLMKRGLLLHEWKTGPNIYLGAPLRLYSIEAIPPAG